MTQKIRIVAKVEGFRRCGVAHTTEGRVHDPGDFSHEEWERLRAEPNLVVHEIDVPDEESEPGAGDKGAAPVKGKAAGGKATG